MGVKAFGVWRGRGMASTFSSCCIQFVVIFFVYIFPLVFQLLLNLISLPVACATRHFVVVVVCICCWLVAYVVVVVVVVLGAN